MNTETKNLPYSGMHRMFGNIFVPLMGLMVLTVVSLRYRRNPDELSALATLAVGCAIVGIAGSYVAFRRVLGRLDPPIPEASRSSLTMLANNMVILAYLGCMFAMVFLRARS